MGNEIYFSDSFGNRISVKSFDWIKEKVFHENNDFWEGASGDCGLNFSNEKLVASLGLIGRESFGFMIDYAIADAERTLSLRYGEHTGETVTAEIGGNPNSYFKEYCMPKEVAWEVIEYFLKTGERHPKYSWEIAEMPEQEF